MVGRIEGQNLEEKTKLFLGMKEGKFHVPLGTHTLIHIRHSLPSQIAPLGSFQDLGGRIEEQSLQERK